MVVIVCPNCGDYRYVELTDDKNAQEQGLNCYCTSCDEFFDSKFDAELEEIK